MYNMPALPYQPNSKSPKRNSNLELYRIIVMLLIVAHHYVVNSGLMEVMEQQPWSAQSIFYYLFGAWGKTGINCFVLITGYFMCQSTITWRKFLKLWFEVVLYGVVIYAIFVWTNYNTLTFSQCIHRLFPVMEINDNFVGCFLLFYLCIPFLNILVQHIGKRQHQLLILLCLFIYTVHGTFPGFLVVMNYVSWFCVLYIIASYLRLHPMKRDNDIRFWGLASVLCVVVSVVTIVGQLWISEHFQRATNPYRFVSDSHVLMAVLTAVSTFMFFKNVRIPYIKWINLVGASTFGVLLIHTSSNAMRKWLWHDTFDCAGHYDGEWYWLRPFIVVILIFTICVIVDRVRIILLERPLFKLKIIRK